MADITKNIIFRIGSEMGPGGLASLKAGYDMFMQIATSVANVYNEMEEMIDVQNNLKIDISKVDNAVRGLVGTMGLMTSANRLTQAGLKLTGEQYASVAKYAASYADAVGVDSAQALDQLVTGLITGNERGLRPFGIALEEGTTKAEKQADAIEEIGKRAVDMAPKLDTAAEKWNAFKDASLSAGASVLEADVGFKNLLTTLVFGESTAKSWTDHLYDFSNGLNEVTKFTETLTKALQNMPVPSGFGAMDWGAAPTGVKIEEPFKVTASRRRGGGGSKPADMTFTEQEAEAGRGAYIESLTGGPPIDQISANVDERMALLREESRMIEDEQETRFVSWQEHLAMERDEYFAHQESQTSERLRIAEYEREMLTAYKLSEFEIMLGAEQQYVNESARLWQSGLQGKMMMMGGFFNALSSLMTVKNKAMFQIGKVAAISEAAVNTYLGATKAYQSLAGIPYVGPFLGALAAAALTAAGLANIARIRAQEYGGGHSGGGSGSADMSGISGGSTPSMGGGGSAPSYIPSNEPQEIKITINMGDDAMFFDAIVDHNDKAARTGRRYFKAA